MPISPAFTGQCVSDAPPPPSYDGRGWSAQWQLVCETGLTGTEITIEGLENTQTDVLVRYELAAGGAGHAWRLLPSGPSFTVPNEPGPVEVFDSYFWLGVEHIFFGPDHLLFVLALLLLVQKFKTLIGAVTAFTVAHSLTLGLAAVGLLNVPGPPVEAVIALSIMFLASEVVKARDGLPRLSTRAPWLVSFGFGLIHGLGFGSALREIGLPQDEILLALFAFNLGVEAGQVAFVVAVLSLGFLLKNMLQVSNLAPSRTSLGYIIGSISAFWTIERILAF